MNRYTRSAIVRLILILCIVSLVFPIACKSRQLRDDSGVVKQGAGGEEGEAGAVGEGVGVGEEELYAKEMPGAYSEELYEGGARSRHVRSTRMPSDLETVYFAFDKATLNEETLERLDANANYLEKYTNLKIEVQGHCDERGSTEYNLALGERRARNVKRYLMDLGISSNRLRTISYGEEKPVDPGQNEAAWAKNRRAAFVKQ